MMRLRLFSQLFFYTTIIAIGFGCGGGGGGESPFAVYTGATTPADITIENSGEIIAAMESQFSQSDIANNSPLGFSTGSSNNTANVNQALDILHGLNGAFKIGVKSYANNQESAEPNMNFELVDANFEFPCDNPGGKIIFSGQADNVTLEFNGTVRFQNCLSDGVTTNGTFRGSTSGYDARIDDVTQIDFSINVTVQATDLNGAVNTAMTGNIHVQINVTDIDSETSETINLDIDDKIAQQQLRLENYTTVSHAADLAFPDEYDSISFAGRFYMSNLGYLTITTETPLLFSQGTFFQTFPDGGGPIIISGDSGDSIQILPNSDGATYQLSIDADGNNVAESNTNEIW